MTHALHLQDVSFSRRLGYGRNSRDVTIFSNLNLQIDTGDRVALLGFNGAGKSTLLRLMAGIFEPDGGTIERHIPSRAILDPSVGMDPVLSGRENVMSLLVLQGTPKTNIERLLFEVEEFAELDTFFNEPLRTYSAGMSTRLMVSAQLVTANGTGLLIDEGFGAADAHFQQKVLDRSRQVFDGVPFLVLASHNLAMLQQYCTRGVVLGETRVKFDGDIDEAVGFYSEME